MNASSGSGLCPRRISTLPTLTEADRSGWNSPWRASFEAFRMKGPTVRAIVPTTLLAALILAPLSLASGPPSARIDADDATARALTRSSSVASTSDSLIVTARREWAFSPAAPEWRITLSPNESLARLPDGSIAVVAPWPPNPGDGTYYPPEDDSVSRDPPPLPANDPYRYSADPDGSMAADEAQHDVGPFDPAYSDEYLPDPWAVDDPSDPDSPVNANTGPPPEADTSDRLEPSDNEPVAEADALDALYEAEASRPDQIVALIAPPQATDALGRRIPARLTITGRESVELRFEPTLIAALPFTATSRLTFNPDALP